MWSLCGIKDSSPNNFNAKAINGPTFTGKFIDLEAKRKTYVELPQTLVRALQRSSSFSFTGWVNFKSVRHRVAPRFCRLAYMVSHDMVLMYTVQYEKWQRVFDLGRGTRE